MTTGREYHHAIELPDGRVVVIGGMIGSMLPSAEIYDPTTDRWSLAGSMIAPRLNDTATLLLDGRVLLAGGDNDAFSALARVEICRFGASGASVAPCAEPQGTSAGELDDGR